MIAGVDGAIIGEQMVRSQPAGRPTKRAQLASKPVRFRAVKKAPILRTATRLRRRSTARKR